MFLLVLINLFQAIVNNLEDAHEQIDKAISTALKQSKPVYISISCNLPGIPHPTFTREPIPFALSPTYTYIFFNTVSFTIVHFISNYSTRNIYTTD